MKKRRTEADIIELFRACQRETSGPLGQSRFTQATGVKESEIVYYWGSWTQFMAQLGQTPNQPTARLDDDEVFREFSRVCLELGKIPASSELRIATRKMGTKTHTVDKRFGTRAAFDQRFRSWLENQEPSLQPILELPGWKRTSPFGRTRVQHSQTASTPALLHPYLPAGLHYLGVLARGDLPPYSADENVALMFERRVADAFKCIGFSTELRGQGTGRVADCIAVAAREGYALIVDAKSRRNGYSLGTEDRKFFEYASTHCRELERRGVLRTYLVIVASEFRPEDGSKAANYLAASPVRGVVMMTADALARIVEDSIQNRCDFTLADFERELLGNPTIVA